MEVSTNLKSQINFDGFYAFCFIYTIMSIFIFSTATTLWLQYVFAIISPIAIYLGFTLLPCRYEFYENRVILDFIFYYKKRVKTIFYKDIKRVRYSEASRYSPKPFIVLDLKSKRSIAYHLNSFSHPTYEKRKEILKFLSDKGLKVEISPDFNEKKELNILS